MDALLVLALAAFLALCTATLRQGLRFRHSASIWLAVSFAALALTAMVGSQLDRVTRAGPALLVLVATAVGLLVHPLALLQFSHTLQPVSRVARTTLVLLAATLLVAVVAIGVADPFAFSDDTGDVSTAVVVVVVALSVAWLGVTGTVGVRLVRFGRELTSSVGRARAWTMATSVLLLGPAVALPFLLPGVTEVTGTLVALVACLATYLGYLPPRWLRWAWARADTQRLAVAELDALRNPADDLTPWVRTAMEVWDGHAAWLEAHDRTVVAVGDAPTRADAVAGTRTVGASVHVEALAGGTWHLVADVSGGRLTVATTLDPILFGDDASDLLLATAARMHSTEVRRELEQEGRRQQAELHREETSRLRDDVLSTLSHELRTPLVTLRGVPELVLQRWEELPAQEVRALLDRVHVNALALHRLVESTLLLAQVRSGEVVARVDDVALADVVETSLDRLRSVGVPVDRVQVEDLGGTTVRTDPVLAGAALAELVHNGLVYSDPPASVRLSVGRDHPRVALTVTDQGRGLDAREDDGYGQPFTRAGEVLTRDRRGLGIGLTLANDLCDLLDAHLVARSPVAGGAVMVLALPAAAPAEPAPDPTRP